MNDNAFAFDWHLDPIVTVVLLSMFGGLVNWMRQKGPKKFGKAVIVLATAAFTGLMAYYVTNALGVSPEYQCVIAGIAGYEGGSLLDEGADMLKKHFTAMKDKNLPGKKNDTGKDDTSTDSL